MSYPISEQVAVIKGGTASSIQPTQQNVNCKGIKVFLQTVSGSGNVVATIYFTDAFGTDYAMLSTAAISGSSPTQATLTIYPGIITAGNLTLNDVLPRNWHVNAVVSGTINYNLSANPIP